MASEPEDLLVIEYHMMDQSRYKTAMVTSSVGVRMLVYPFNLVRTRLQMQQDKSVYKGTFDAMGKIFKNEGFRGLYRGLGFNLCQIPSSLCYMYTYEKMRSHLKTYPYFSDGHSRTIISGALASFVGQTIAVPVDIVIQHIQLLGTPKGKTNEKIKKKIDSLQRLNLPDHLKNSQFGAARGIAQEIYRVHGLWGFYHGYFMSLFVFVPSSMIWWYSYQRLSDILMKQSDSFEVTLDLPYGLLLNINRAISGVCAGMLSVTCTNPMDIFRTKMQVEGKNFSTVWSIIKKEKRWYTKGLTARLFPSVIFSLLIAILYENIKIFSLKEEYRHLYK